jgi:hypothetical protein
MIVFSAAVQQNDIWYKRKILHPKYAEWLQCHRAPEMNFIREPDEMVGVQGGVGCEPDGLAAGSGITASHLVLGALDHTHVASHFHRTSQYLRNEIIRRIRRKLALVEEIGDCLRLNEDALSVKQLFRISNVHPFGRRK